LKSDPDAASGGPFSKGDQDYELIEAIGAGDILAFEMLVKKYSNPVLNFIFRYLGDRFAAEDIAQEVFFKVYNSAPKFEPKGRVSTWIFRIAYNLSVNEILRRKRFCGISEINGYGLEPASEPASDLRELGQELMEAMGGLPEKQRAALLLRVNEDLSYAEIGSVLATSISSVESLIFRARENLRKILLHGSKE
jgi:RNA polymerase sigma-70 factor (ECF subfamily)